MNRNREPSYAIVFAHVLPKLQRVSRELGYALTVHGSMMTDMDLVAVPWTSNAVPAQELVDAIVDATGSRIGHPDYPKDENPSERPHGRLSWSLYFGVDVPYIDLAVMPREKPKRNTK